MNHDIAHSSSPLRLLATLASAATLALASPAQAQAPAATQAATETLPSGVKVEMTKLGTGASPGASDTVKVHYRGTLADGTEFDSSYKRGSPAEFPLNRVIPCWTQGVQKLKVGGKARLTCPGATAYGERGVPGTIGPNATLTFDVELLEVRK